MGLREMQDMEHILRVRGGARHDEKPINCCRQCEETNRRLEAQMTQRPNQPRQNLGVVEWRRNRFAVIWDAAVPWLQVVAVWASIVLVVCFSPQIMHRLDQWLAQ